MFPERWGDVSHPLRGCLVSGKMQAFRHYAATGVELPDLAAPMQDIVAEEEDKDDESK